MRPFPFFKWQVLPLAFAYLALLVSPSRAEAPVKVAILQPAPMEKLGTDGSVTGVSRAAVSSGYTLVSVEGQKVVLQDAQGNRIRVALAATDYMPSAPTVAPTSATPPAASSTAASTPVAPPPAPGATSSSDTTPGTPIPDNEVARINTGLRVPLFSNQPFWGETALLVANRLGLKLEDRTKWEAAYRKYFVSRSGIYDPAPILGASGYCVAVYADADDKPTSVLIAFTNSGDYQTASMLTNNLEELKHPSSDKSVPGTEALITQIQTRIKSLKGTFEEDRKTEQAALTQNLTALFGEPQKMSMGGSADTSESALRWDWHDVSFLLSCQPDSYNLLHIVPLAVADKHGRTERIPHDEMIAKLTAAVEHRVNGDVVITQLPMADQGRKGYCVPATWERVLRYTGVPGDMYTLGRVGEAGFGGGERGATVAQKLNDTLYDYGRKAQFLKLSKFDIFSLHTYLDQGIPIFWGVNPSGYNSIEDRYALCDRDKDWENWKKLLGQTRMAGYKLPPLDEIQGHQVLITGYNSQTNEIAWSDPWGRTTTERWMTLEEAQHCSLGEFYIITW